MTAFFTVPYRPRYEGGFILPISATRVNPRRKLPFRPVSSSWRRSQRNLAPLKETVAFSDKLYYNSQAGTLVR